MPNYYSRLNLASAIFPFYTEAAGRTIMVPENDENFDRYNAANTVQDKGVPQVFYMHNVVPISGGFQSVGYTLTLAGVPGHTDFDTCFPAVNADDTNFFFVPAGGQNYIYDATTSGWISNNPIAPNTIPAGTLVTTAYVQGQTFFYYANYGCFTYDGTTKSFDPVTLTGLTAANIVGICAANGYMIAWTNNSIAWSSLTEPTNFTPSIDTGAGGGAVADAKGPINFCLSVSGGFLIYCEKNIVGASYTANTAFPYIITESAGSGGVASIDSVGYQDNLPYHIAMTTAGIQQISLNSSIPTMPEVSDFLNAQLFEDFDETTMSFSQDYIGSQLNIKFSSVSTRFVVISYGMNAPDYTHAILYDFGLNRYGKLKLNHRAAFQYAAPSPYGLITYAQLLTTPISSLGTATYASFFSSLPIAVVPKQNLAFLQEDGTVQLVDFSIGEETANGVFIIGKLQFKRGNVMVHQRSDVETVNLSSTFNYYLLPTFDGKDFGPAVGPIAPLSEGALVRRFAKRYTADNISLCFVGAYNLTSIIFNFTIGGWR